MEETHTLDFKLPLWLIMQRCFCWSCYTEAQSFISHFARLMCLPRNVPGIQMSALKRSCRLLLFTRLKCQSGVDDKKEKYFLFFISKRSIRLPSKPPNLQGSISLCHTAAPLGKSTQKSLEAQTQPQKRKRIKWMWLKVHKGNNKMNHIDA